MATIICCGERGETVDAAIEETFAKLKVLKVFDFYKTRVLTQEQQGWVESICDHYLGALPHERASIHSMITAESSFLFFMYAKAMAVEAVRERQEGQIFKGLIALVVENGVFDRRDSMMVLVLLHHSAVKIGARRVTNLPASSRNRRSANWRRFIAVLGSRSGEPGPCKIWLSEGYRFKAILPMS
jgi:hypothetical protein